ncbi:hypothetical protein [Actinophytocola sp.]|uniref:hypothetical protein n=1 Tax=Actinophytocola sp. TaxID=1872138 RepID=UPI002D7EA6CA|nr:hypothetical protein [Actinophytocola sp.]HET9142063.1 hypothetical protein [Actinophytocola sp.]HEU5110396.1 hypothetical protein [Micromonosporaceae bacterium]
MGTRVWTRCVGLVLALVAGLALTPVPASADTLYLRVLWIRCQDQSEPFSDEIRLRVNGTLAGAWNDVDTRETHWVDYTFITRNHAFSGGVTIEVREEDGQEDLIGWVWVDGGLVDSGEHEGLASQIDGEYIVRYVVTSSPS